MTALRIAYMVLVSLAQLTVIGGGTWLTFNSGNPLWLIWGVVLAMWVAVPAIPRILKWIGED